MKRFKYNTAIHKIALSAIVASLAGVVACDDVYWDREAYDGFIDTFGVKHPSQFDLNNNVCAYIARESMGIKSNDQSEWLSQIKAFHNDNPSVEIAQACLDLIDSDDMTLTPGGDSNSNGDSNKEIDPRFIKCLRAQIEIIQSRCDAVSVSKTGDENEGRMYIQVAEDITSKAQLDSTIFACAQNDKNKDKNVCSDTATTQEHRNILNYRQCPNGYSLVVDGDKADRTYVCARTVCKSVAVHFETDMLNCGVCGKACDATENCTGGECVPAKCPEEQIRCNGKCIDPLTDPKYCGADTLCVEYTDCTKKSVDKLCVGGTCASSCPTDQPNICGEVCLNFSALNIDRCDNGKVLCKENYENVDGQVNTGCEVNLKTDNNHCGQKNNVCTNGRICQNGTCLCPENYIYCNDRCIDPMTDPKYCSAELTCDHLIDCTQSAVNKLCVNGSCSSSCPSGQSICGNYCVDFAKLNIKGCSKGTITCESNFADIDKNVENGCEVNLMTDSNHCGATDKKCTYPQTCQNGACTCPHEQPDVCGSVCLNFDVVNVESCDNGTIKKCKVGYADVDKNINNGCEVNLNTDNDHCGEVNNKCTNGRTCQNKACKCPDGQTYCEGKCVVLSSVNIDSCSDDKITCKSGFDRCDKAKVACQDLNQDKEHCGKCSTKCNKDESCYNGKCVVNECANGQTLCDVEGKAECKYTMSEDAAHCGACNYACSAHPLKNAKSTSCKAGQCQYVCDDDFTNIGGSTASTINCVDFMTNSNHCGKKDNVCKDGNVCIGGHCKANPCTNSSETACLVGEENKCFNISDTNKDHCGACNYKCSEHKVTNATSDVCKAGKCQYTCNTGFVNVGGGATADTIKCIDPLNDYNHCGKLSANTYEDCSKNPGTKCVDGVCTLNCPTGQQVCGTHCLNFTELNIDKCNNGALVCLKDFENVDGKVENGCEVNLKTDSNNCGIKGRMCENGYCNNGTCQTTNCPQNELPCGKNGACENVVNNVNHCGYCGNTCSGTTSVCSNRKCVECVNDGQCSGDKNRCNNLSGICQECLISNHCVIKNSLYVSCEVGSCNLIACKSGFHKSEDGKSCVEDSPKACGSTTSDCTMITNSNEVACNAGNCEVMTCFGDNHVSVDKKSCVQNSKEACGSATNDCTKIANSNEVACNAGNCEVKTCTGDNHVSADKKTCEADTINACGPKIDDCKKMKTGNVEGVICQGGECKVSKCKKGYDVNGDQTECVEKATGGTGTDPGNGGEGSGSGSEGTGAGTEGGTGGTGTGDNVGTESP